MQVKTSQGWESVKPYEGKAYSYATRREAAEMLEMCYPDQVYGIEVRVEAVEV